MLSKIEAYKYCIIHNMMLNVNWLPSLKARWSVCREAAFQETFKFLWIQSVSVPPITIKSNKDNINLEWHLKWNLWINKTFNTYFWIEQKNWSIKHNSRQVILWRSQIYEMAPATNFHRPIKPLMINLLILKGLDKD